MEKLANVLDRFFRAYTPEPLVMAFFLTIICFFTGLFMEGNTVSSLLNGWGNGFWSLNSFSMQMAMMLICGHVIADSPSVQKLLGKLVAKVQQERTAIILTGLVASFAALLNWGLGLIVGAFLSKQFLKRFPEINYRVLVASAYSGFLVWHGGLSGSIPLSVATDSNFSVKLMGTTIPVSETIGSVQNLLLLIGVLVAGTLVNVFVFKKFSSFEKVELNQEDAKVEGEAGVDLSFGEKLSRSKIVGKLAYLLGLAYIANLVFSDQFSININSINFIFLFIGLMLQQSLGSLYDAFLRAAKSAAPILLLFPFYGGLMGLVKDSGIAQSLSQLLLEISTQDSFALMSFLSAGILNVFVPSGGGQWAVQAPVVIPAALEMGVPLSKVTLAVAWGDAWTNMLQPFWAIPLLGIAGIALRDIMAHCFLLFVASGLVLSFGLFFL